VRSQGETRRQSCDDAGGELVKEEMRHKKRGKLPVKSRKQVVAIDLSKARKPTSRFAQAKLEAKNHRRSRKS